MNTRKIIGLLTKVAAELTAAAPIKAVRRILGYKITYDMAGLAPKYLPHWLNDFQAAGWTVEKSMTDLRFTNRREWYTMQAVLFRKGKKLAMFYRGQTTSKTGLASRIITDEVNRVQKGNIDNTLLLLESSEWDNKKVIRAFEKYTASFTVGKIDSSSEEPARAKGKRRRRRFERRTEFGTANQPQTGAAVRDKLERMGVKVLSVTGQTTVVPDRRRRTPFNWNED